jgi:hypothetical protein
MKKALFPISVDSNDFTSEITVSALKHITANYECIVFMIADSLQIYNKAKQIISGKPFELIIKEFRERNKYFEERIKWLDKISGQLDVKPNANTWEYIKAESMCDKYFYRIYKLLVINYHTDETFKSDIEKAAVSHLRKHKAEFDKRELYLNTLYIIEEIALNLRIKLWLNIYDEYYIGKYHKPMLKLYQGHYNIGINDICEKSSSEVFKFFEGNKFETNKIQWKEKYAR